ncbi:hypothetical protein NYE69_12800 [Paenibacillus sp. FSL R5-0527]|uniref:hypothetical protein n=1 Tax=Paenibacillus sp. FSL R5-0527 TaxID=2975321 RepID=UPI000979D34B|nr:hypothetical protein BK140_17045 [Paenibacillus macerans]
MTNEEYVKLMNSDLEAQKKMLSVMKSYGANRWWLSDDVKHMSYYQIYENTILIEFEVFQKGVELLLGREVETVEFSPGLIELLQIEAKKKYSPPQ